MQRSEIPPKEASEIPNSSEGRPPVANATNLASAQDVHFRGMWLALAPSERCYGGKILEANDFVDQIF